MEDHFEADIAAVQRIAAVPTILDIVCRSTGMGFAAVARVTEDRWIACQVLDNIHFGLPPGGELKVETTLCHEVRQLHEVIVFDHAAEDDKFRDHHTPRLYGLQSYISVPIMLKDGRFFGTLCAIDPAPHRVNTPEIVGTFKLFAELIAHHLDADDKLRESSAALAAAEHTAELRDQFIAVLGHDLRNPLAALDAGTSRLLRDGWTEKSPTILRLMKSSIRRSLDLVENVMDFARAKLGGGILLQLDAQGDLEATLMNVIEEVRSTEPDRLIEATIALDQPVAVDHSRLAQMFANLLGNAIIHGTAGAPVRVFARVEGDAFELSVTNGGAPIPAEVVEQLFLPFVRGDAQSRQGLGLGLYIASQIAQAHGGRIDVTSNETKTTFTFRMPLS